MCGTNDRASESKFCDECLEEMCPKCEELSELCCCNDEEFIPCGDDPEAWCRSLDGDQPYCCNKCGEINCVHQSEMVTPPLNAFARARLLKSLGKL